MVTVVLALAGDNPTSGSLPNDALGAPSQLGNAGLIFGDDKSALGLFTHRSDTFGALVVDEHARGFARPLVRFVTALFRAATIDQEAHVHGVEPRNVGVGRITECGRAPELAARHHCAIGCFPAAKIAEVQDAFKINETIMHIR